MNTTAAIGVAQRSGIGKLCHLEVCFVVARKMKDKVFDIRKVSGTLNPANVLTKHVEPKDIQAQLLDQLV